MAGAAVFAFALWAITPSAVAQDDSTDEVFSETQELIDSIQEQLDRMAKRPEARDGALAALARQIDEAAALPGDRGSRHTPRGPTHAPRAEAAGVTAARSGPPGVRGRAVGPPGSSGTGSWTSAWASLARCSMPVE